MRMLFPGVRFGNCVRHALTKLPKKRVAIASPIPQGLRLTVLPLVVPGAPAERLAGVCTRPEIASLCGPRCRHGWACQRCTYAALVSGQEGGRYAVLVDPQMPVTSTLLNQAHNAIERQLFALKGFHHPDGSEQAFPDGASPPIQPDTVSASRPACRPLWRGSRRWAITYSRLVPPSAHPHLWRLSLSADTLHH
jgi:hypothetical protein